MVTGGHVLCGSTVYFVRADGSYIKALNAAAAPGWLGASGQAAGVCVRDVLS